MVLISIGDRDPEKWTFPTALTVQNYPIPHMTVPNATPAVDTLNDATAEFFATLNDPRRWIIKKSVPIFKAHERKDPATGKLIQVDSIKLARIANNLQRMEREGGVPARLTLGHTEPGKPETQQPPVAGYYRNARVQPFGPSGELAVVADEWLDPQYAAQRKNFPYRSSEYYDDTEQITGVALLTRDPFLDLGVVAYSKSAPGMVQYSNDGQPHAGYRFYMGNETQYADRYPAPWGSNQPTGTPMANSKYSNNVPYQGPWPGPAYKKHNIGHMHQSGGAIYEDGNDMMDSPMSARSLQDVNRVNRTDLYGPGMVGPRSRKPNPRVPSMQKVIEGPDEQIHMSPEDYSRSRSRNARYSQQGNRMYGRGRAGRYADGMAGAGGAGMSNDPLQTAIMGLQQALEALEEMGEAGASGPGSPPPGPFPAGGGMGPGGPGAPGAPPMEEEDEEGMTPNSGYSRYANQNQSRRSQQRPQSSQRPQQYGERPMQPRGDRRYARYDRAGEPAPVPTSNAPRAGGTPPARTISGLPVGYAMKVEQLQYQNAQLNEALRVLYYERDQADTEACAAEIQRLAQLGYNVGEYEFQELKAKPKDQRPAFIQHIQTKYQRIGTNAPPPLLGDPTPGPGPDMNRPATKEEMEAALKLSSRSNDPNAYSQALQYIRSGGNATPYAPVTPYGQPNYGPAQPPMMEFAPGSDIEEQLNGMGNPFSR